MHVLCCRLEPCLLSCPGSLSHTQGSSFFLSCPGWCCFELALHPLIHAPWTCRCWCSYCFEYYIEVLVSAVMPIMSVYRLPQGQYGYSGHVSTSLMLPLLSPGRRAPSNNIAVYVRLEMMSQKQHKQSDQ